MQSGGPISVRAHPGSRSVEVFLERPFTPADLDIIRGLPGRRWDGHRRVWIVPGGDDVIEVLASRLGADRIQVSSAPVDAQVAPEALERMRDALTLRG